SEFSRRATGTGPELYVEVCHEPNYIVLSLLSALSAKGLSLSSALSLQWQVKCGVLKPTLRLRRLDLIVCRGIRVVSVGECQPGREAEGVVAGGELGVAAQAHGRVFHDDQRAV